MKLLYRTRARLRALCCKASGRHVASPFDWGYSFRGKVDLYCPHCLQLVRRIPLEDFESMGAVFSAVEISKRAIGS